MNLLKSKTYRADLDTIASLLDMHTLANCTILLTGGLGLICSAIVDYLVEYESINRLGIRVVVAARDKIRFEEKYSAYPFVEFIMYEAQETFSYPKRIDYIIYGAGLASPEKYIDAPVETLLSNIIGINNLLDYCRYNSVKKVIYISSSEVYGILETDSPYIEDKYGLVNIDAIRSSYPVAKRASEMLCRSYYSEYGINTVIVRPGHVFGPSASEKDRRISSEFAYRAARGENLELKSAGLQRRSYIYSLDCVKAIMLVLINGTIGEAYNVGAERVTSIRDMALSYARVGGVSLIATEPTEMDITHFNPMQNSSLCIDKIKALGYSDTFSPTMGFEHTIMILKEILMSMDSSEDD